MRKLILILVPFIFLISCKTFEYHRISTIPKLDIKETVNTVINKEEEKEKTTGEKLAGVWLARFVTLPENNGRSVNLGAIEILFCPSAKNDFTKCRIGVAWSKKVHPMEQPAPPSARKDVTPPQALQPSADQASP